MKKQNTLTLLPTMKERPRGPVADQTGDLRIVPVGFLPGAMAATKTEAMALKPAGKPPSALNKAEATAWLRALGEEANKAWTSIEIKDRI